MQNQLQQTTCLKHCTDLTVNINLELPEELCLRRCVSKYNEALKLIMKEENVSIQQQKQIEVEIKPKAKTFLQKLGF